MAEPDFYAIHRSGIRFERNSTTIEQPSGTYSGYYGFGGVHTWDDWGLYCTDVAIGAPETERYTVTIPGRHGVLDLSTVLTGNPVYKNRTLTFSFCWLGRMERWHDLYATILTELHGKIRYVTLDTQPGWHYVGRCSVSSMRQDGVYSTFDVTMDAEPFRRRNWRTDAPWPWDPFNFETDMTLDETYYSGITIPPQTEKSIFLYHCQRIFKPIIYVRHASIYSSDGDWYFTVQNSSNKYTEDDFPISGLLEIDISALTGMTYNDSGGLTVRIANCAQVVENHPEYNVITVGFRYYEGVL